MPWRGTSRGLFAQNIASFNVYSLPWVWMIDARNPGALVAGAVADWPDLIGVNNPQQGVAGLRPIWVANGFNGRPSVRGDGLTQFVRTAVFGLAQPYEIWSVCRWNGAGGAAERIFDGVGGPIATSYIQRSSTAVLIQVFAGGVTASNSFAVTANSAQSIGVYFDGANSEVIIGGVSVPEPAIGVNNPDGITIFASRTGSSNAPADLCWAAVSSRALTANERILLRAYLNQEWGPLA